MFANILNSSRSDLAYPVDCQNQSPRRADERSVIRRISNLPPAEGAALFRPTKANSSRPAYRSGRDDSGMYRIIYTARIADAVYVLHAFQKKTQATSKSDIDIAKERYTELMRGRK